MYGDASHSRVPARAFHSGDIRTRRSADSLSGVPGTGDDPASGESPSGRAAGTDATLTVSPDQLENVASGQPPSTTVVGPSSRQSVVGRYRLAGLAACVVALAVAAAIVGLAWRKSPNEQAQTSSSHGATSSVAGAPAPGAGASARSGPCIARARGSLSEAARRSAPPAGLAGAWVPVRHERVFSGDTLGRKRRPLVPGSHRRVQREVATCFPPEQRERIVLRAQKAQTIT